MVIMVNWPVPTPRSGTQGEISMGGKAVIMVNLPRLLEVGIVLRIPFVLLVRVPFILLVMLDKLTY